MQLGYIGLGKMGKNMVERLLTKNHNIVVWNRSGEVAKEMEMLGAIAAESIEELVLALSTPRSIWLMLPAGEPTHSMIEHLSRLLSPGDTLINGANEFYKDTKLQAEMLYKKGVNLLDAGVSGGPGGAKNGACAMIGGKKEIFSKHEQLFADISAPNAYQFFEGAGAGHFVKMVHNGIEYGMMQAIAEGFDVLKKSDYNLNLSDVATIYANRSVIESRLVSWLLSGLMEYGQTLEHISGSAGSGSSISSIICCRSSMRGTMSPCRSGSPASLRIRPARWPRRHWGRWVWPSG